MAPTFSIVIPTYRRAGMLRRVLPSYIRTEPAEIVVVDDGGDPARDGSLAFVEASGARLVTLPTHGGLPAARNAGAERATAEWVVFGEDDVWFPPHYPSTLIEHAGSAGVLVAAGAVPFVDPGLLERPEELERAIGEAPGDGRPPDRFVGTAWPVRRLPSGDVLTPMLSAMAAIHRSVFETVRFDPGYRGNAFREETDFFLTCESLGIGTMYCPHAACGHVKHHSRALGGGSWAMSRPRYAWQMGANNWRLLRKHGPRISEVRRAAGRPGGPLRIQAEFLASLLGRVRPRRA